MVLLVFGKRLICRMAGRDIDFQERSIVVVVLPGTVLHRQKKEADSRKGIRLSTLRGRNEIANTFLTLSLRLFLNHGKGELCLQ